MQLSTDTRPPGSTDLPRPAAAAQPSRPGPLVPAGPVTHAHYRREPYVRCRTGSGSVDAKAVAWTRTQVLLHWIDNDGAAHNRWTPASTVRRINRDESAWRDPYDDYRFYYAPATAAAA